jgi:hypothetical protein
MQLRAADPRMAALMEAEPGLDPDVLLETLRHIGMSRAKAVYAHPARRGSQMDARTLRAETRRAGG